MFKRRIRTAVAATTLALAISALGGALSAVPASAAITCTPIYGGSGSGRGGGYKMRIIGYRCSDNVAPLAPTGVSAAQTGAQLNVSWTPDPTAAAYITSSTLTATPINGSSAPIVTATVTGTTTSGVLTAVQPSTTYSVTVTNSDAGGASPPSNPVIVTTNPASTPPGAPAIGHEWWAGTQLALSWTPGSSGDSPVDQFEVLATGTGGDTPVVVDDFVDGTSTSDYLPVDSTLDLWSVQVRAHNASGWGAWSNPFAIAGIGGD